MVAMTVAFAKPLGEYTQQLFLNAARVISESTR